MSTAQPSRRDTSDVWFEIKPAGSQWLLPAVGVLLGVGLFYWCWPLTTILSWVGAIIGLLTAGAMGLVMVFCLQDRTKSVRFYRDRAEIHVGGRLRHALKYRDVRYVFYGFRGENTHLLSMMGEDEKVTYDITVMGRPDLHNPGEPTKEDVFKLRDHLWKVVTDHIRKTAATPAGYAWMDGIEIVRTGLRQNGAVTPWSQLDVDVDEAANKMTLMRNGEVWTWAYLSTRNIMPVITVLLEFMNAALDQEWARGAAR